jgi:DNA modification methylase
MMYDRLVLMKDLLSETGTIYIHLDYRMFSHIKLLCEEIFGANNFRNELIWHYDIGGRGDDEFAKKHDNILSFAKDITKKYFDPTNVYIPYLTQTEGRKNPLISEEKLARGKIPTNVWNDIPVNLVMSQRLKYPTQKPEALLERIIYSTSKEGDLIADFFCGSGTTMSVAEKLKRRWIGVDLGRYSIHTTRKRLLEIEHSKSLNDEGKKYGKKTRPFEILNLGKYERQFWQVKAFGKKDEKQALYEYLAFILKLYGAEPIAGSSHIHGKKGNALVYIGAVDAPVTIQEVTDALQDAREMSMKELHVLGWEWEMGLNDAIQEVAKQMGVRLKLRIIPMDAINPQAAGRSDVKFFELAYFKTDIESKGLNVKVKLEDFVIPHTDLISAEVKSSIKKWSDWIDYWAVDFEFQNDTFNNGWTSYRTKQERKLKLTADHEYKKPGTYKVFVKIIDIFGIDTSQVYEIKVK